MPYDEASLAPQIQNSHTTKHNHKGHSEVWPAAAGVHQTQKHMHTNTKILKAYGVDNLFLKQIL